MGYTKKEMLNEIVKQQSYIRIKVSKDTYVCGNVISASISEKGFIRLIVKSKSGYAHNIMVEKLPKEVIKNINSNIGDVKMAKKKATKKTTKKSSTATSKGANKTAPKKKSQMTVTEIKQRIGVLTTELEVAKDQATKKKIRAKLRNLGHAGGVGKSMKKVKADKPVKAAKKKVAKKKATKKSTKK